MSGIYLHIPFCESKCIYCGFYSVAGSRHKEKFIPALKREILGRRDFFARNSSPDDIVSTLYVGGGTPSVLSISLLKEAVECLRESFRFTEGAFSPSVPPDVFEFTVEVNPDDITPEYAGGLYSLGVNRVSMGVQSFDDRHLAWMKRRHTSEQAVRAFHTLREAGFRNISLDLIFGYSMLTDKEWMCALKKITELSPEHISAYQMMLDEGTPLERSERGGTYTPPGEDVCAAQYAMLQSVLKQAGYIQYEVSNFALRKEIAGKRILLYSRHNSSYWNRIPYIGFGPGAHSFCGRKREWNLPDVEEYCNSAFYEKRDGETLSETDEFNETVMLGLRQTGGLEFRKLNPELLGRISKTIGRLVDDGLLVATGGACASGCGGYACGENADTNPGIKIPSEKLFVSDGIIRELFID